MNITKKHVVIDTGGAAKVPQEEADKETLLALFDLNQPLAQHQPQFHHAHNLSLKVIDWYGVHGSAQVDTDDN